MNEANDANLSYDDRTDDDSIDASEEGLIHRWFVRYNPLYFVSAASVLLGVLLVSRGLGEMDWRWGRVLLIVAVQVYELLLLGGCALLHRRARMTRPAVILALSAVLFLFDCTFEIEVMSLHLDRFGPSLAVVWVVLVVWKLAALVWIFRLRASRSAFVLPTLAAVAIAVTSQLLDSDLSRVAQHNIHLAATWIGAVLAAFVIRRPPRVTSADELDEWGETVLGRALRAAAWIWGGFFALHLLAWSVVFDLDLGGLHAVPVFLLLTFVSSEERVVWAAAALALVAARGEPVAVAPIAGLLAVLSVLRARDLGQRRFYVGTVMAIYVVGWTLGWRQGPWPEPSLWWSFLIAVALVLMVWRLKIYSGLLPLLPGLLLVRKQLAELSTLGWGLLFLMIGFLTLGAGVAVNWSQREKEED